ncbi:MAG: hypothetical protein P1V51_22650 [Deltaproteobacteria bacterium]|nr:hypothetical protein [Deltaproteobacteria bacterium]
MAETVSSVVDRLLEVLEAGELDYAIGGAVALAAWSEPRATADVDLVLWVTGDDLDRAFDLVESAGVEFDRSASRQRATREGLFVGYLGPIRVDVFVPSIPFYEEALARRVRTTILGRPAWIHSAEVLAVFKLLFFRPKDLLDVERMVEVQGTAFDRDFVRAALVDLMGEDERIDRWDEISSRHP